MIRSATPADAEAIAAVNVRSWQAGYRGLFPDDYLDNLSVSRRAEGWIGWLADATQITAVYESSAGIVGFVTIGPSRDAGAHPRTGELISIYALPDFVRRGIGTALMHWATDFAVACAWTDMTLWTLEGNFGARAFYERRGWVRDGATRREPFAGWTVTQVRYAWRTPPAV